MYLKIKFGPFHSWRMEEQRVQNWKIVRMYECMILIFRLYSLIGSIVFKIFQIQLSFNYIMIWTSFLKCFMFTILCFSSIWSWCWNYSLVAAWRALSKQGERGRLGGHRVRGLRLHFCCGQVISLWPTVSYTIWNLCVLCRGNRN